MESIYLAGAVRTPIGRFGGSLRSLTAADLGVAVAQECLRRTNIPADQVDDSIWGCARQAGGGPNVARQITFRVGSRLDAPACESRRRCFTKWKSVKRNGDWQHFASVAVWESLCWLSVFEFARSLIHTRL